MLQTLDVDIASELALGISEEILPDEPGFPGTYKFLNDDIVDRGRWSIYHFIVFEYDGDLYGFNYSEPATEYQETSLEERFEASPVPLYQVEAHQITTTEYRIVK